VVEDADVPRPPSDLVVTYVSAQGERVTCDLPSVDVDRLVGGRPVREFAVYAGQRHYTGLYWCATTGSHLAYESLLERDRMLLADFDPQVVAVAPQPFHAAGDDEGRRRNRIPDLLLRLVDDGIRVVDVKPARAAEKPEVAASFSWMGRVCESQGWAYEVWSGCDPTLLANARWLARARRPGLVSDEVLAAALRVGETGTTFRSAVSQIESAAQCGPGPARLAVETFLWRGLWSTDLSSPLTPDHVIEPVGSSA
jgi:hypothetical protein